MSYVFDSYAFRSHAFASYALAGAGEVVIVEEEEPAVSGGSNYQLVWSSREFARYARTRTMQPADLRALGPRKREEEEIVEVRPEPVPFSPIPVPEFKPTLIDLGDSRLVPDVKLLKISARRLFLAVLMERASRVKELFLTKKAAVPERPKAEIGSREVELPGIRRATLRARGLTL